MADAITVGLAVFSGIILTGFLAEIFFSKTNIPDVLILFLLGILIGPILGYVSPADIGNIAPFFTTFALIFILFEGALHINVFQFIRQATNSMLLSTLSFVVSALIVGAVGILLGLPPIAALLLGCVLGGTSSAVVVPIMRRLKVHSTTKLVLSLESAITDVLCIVSVLLLIEFVKLQTLDVWAAVQSLFQFFFVSFIVGVVAGLIFIFLNGRIQRFNKSYMLTIAVLTLLYSLITVLGGNGEIGALAFGLTLGNATLLPFGKKDAFTLARPEKFFYAQVTFFVKVFFFVYLGTLISFENPWPFVIGFIITFLLFIVRPIPVWFLHRKDSDLGDRAVMESLIPRGLAAAVLVQLILTTPEAALLGSLDALPMIVLSVIFFSIIFSSFAIFLVEHFRFVGTSVLMARLYRVIFPKKAPEIKKE